MTNTELVMQLYTAYFNRVADKAGVDYWVGEMETKGWSLDDVAQSFADQTEYTSLYNGLSNTQVVEKVYQNVLNRDGEADGIEYWSGELESVKISVSQLVQAVVFAATEKIDGVYKNEEDALLFTNKIYLSQYAYDNNVNETSITLESITTNASSVSSIQNSITNNFPNDSTALTREELITLIANYYVNPTEENANVVINANTSQITDMSSLFNYAIAEALDLSPEKPITGGGSFKQYFTEYSFNLDISKWDVSSVTDMSDMFSLGKLYFPDGSYYEVPYFNFNQDI